MSSINPDGMGGLNLNDGEIKIPAKEQRFEQSIVKRYADRNHRGKFRLVTIREMTNTPAEEVEAKLLEVQANLEDAAMRTGSPFPYPLPKNKKGDVEAGSVYGVYLDEDLFGLDRLVYTFIHVPGSQCRCYIHATGDGREDWTINIVHEVNRSEADKLTGLRTVRWRIVTIESLYQFRMIYFLENTPDPTNPKALPVGYSHNYSLDNIHYIGGNTWTAMSIEPDDRIPIYALASADNDRYTPIGVIMRSLGQSRVQSLVSYSATPTHVFTWNKDNLVINKRVRKASQTIDWKSYTNEKVLRFTRNHEYSLDIPIRIKDETNPGKKITACEFREFSKGSATYVGNLNNPVTPSRYQSIDYGTDAKRLAIESYTMETDVIRVKKSICNYMPNPAKVSVCNPCYIPIPAANYDMSLFLLHHFKNRVHTGSIKHPVQTKAVQGKRTFQYGDSYKYWWAYGAIDNILILTDERYRIIKTARGEQPSRVRIGSMLDLGDIKVDETSPNRIITTWESEPNPPTGFFGLEEGIMVFRLMYTNPPIMGHDSIYYYEINPEPVPDSGADMPDYANITGAAREAGNFLKNMYTQLLGALGGGGLDSLDIGEIIMNQDDNNTLLAREPTPTQLAHMIENPEHFPVGYFEQDLIEYELDTFNQGYYTVYNSDQSVAKTVPFIKLLKTKV